MCSDEEREGILVTVCWQFHQIFQSKCKDVALYKGDIEKKIKKKMSSLKFAKYVKVKVREDVTFLQHNFTVFRKRKYHILKKVLTLYEYLIDNMKMQ